MARAAADAPEEHVANVTRDFGRVSGECVGVEADVGEIACGGEGEDAEGFDLLGVC